ncbi:MAG: hypothetical protein O3B86_07035 [Planctomycetota bacterium]|nr:hypothetical protein [Planctomycetota bacterium]
MRFPLWLLAATALTTGGCVLPCWNSACSSSGEPRFVTPMARFMGTEKLLSRECATGGCATGRCQPKAYLTFSKYWPGMDAWTSSSMATRCANRHLLKQQVQDWTLISKHYKDGFRQSFVDIANGESGEVPPVPPPKYWNTHYRTEKGKRSVELWFDGYRAGTVLAAAEFGPMKTIGASYDWSIQKPNSSRVKTTAILPGVSISPGTDQNMSPAMGMPGSDCQSCQTGQPYQGGMMPTQQPSAFPMQQQPQTYHQPPNYPTPPGFPIGQPNGFAPPQNYAPGLSPDPGFNPYQDSPGQFGASPGNLGLPSPQSSLPSPGYSSPDYSSPGGSGNGQFSPPSQFPIPIPHARQSGPGDQHQNGPLTPGFSGPPRGQVIPGRLGPPDEFKTDPPVFRRLPPGR